MWPFRRKKNGKHKEGKMVEPKKHDDSSSSAVPVGARKDPMNDTAVICKDVADNLEELNRLKAQVKQKAETARLKVDRFHGRILKK